MDIEVDKNNADLENYIIRSLSKIQHKRWEIFIISRIIHGICKDHPDIEFVCQQMVSRPNRRPALTDIYFPQFSTHLEVDEAHHAHEENEVKDRERDRDIINATDHKICHICTYRMNNNIKESKRLSHIINEVDLFLESLISRKIYLQERGEWQGWDFGARFNPVTYRSLGKLRVQDGPAFRTHKAALECFGYERGHYQPSVWRIPQDHKGRSVWFPKLYDNNDWHNELSSDGKMINYNPIRVRFKSFSMS